MNERQLYSFIKAAELGSFSKAARESYISVPALVQQIDLLESSVGFELFIRTTHGLKLTPGGEEFYRAAKQILSIYESALAKGKKDNAAVIRIPIPPEHYPAFLMDAIQQFKKEQTEVKIELITCDFNEQLDALRRHTIDLTVIAEPAENYLKDLVYLPLADSTFSFAMSPANPLSRRKMLTAEDLKGTSILCGGYPYLKYPMEEVLQNVDAEVKKQPKEYDRNTKIESMLSNEILVIHKHWADVYENMLRVIPSDIHVGTMGAVYRKNAYDSVSSFIECLKKILAE